MHARLNAQFCKVLLVLGAITLFHWSEASGKPVSSAELVATTKPNKYYTVNTFKLSDGAAFEEEIINGPPAPPPGFEAERQAVSLPEPDSAAGVNILTAPAFNWVFGCSAVSGAMIASYYDRNGFPNMYTGPTDGGVMPMNNSSWPTWSDGSQTYPSCPLIASRNGVDGRTTKGSIDDYWVLYNSTADDPYITGAWTQHTWGDAIGDYMKTSQSAHSNVDGSTSFYTFTSSATQLTCSQMVSYAINDRDGTYGRKLFYEARGYTVTDCYNQKTDNQVAGGFSFSLFKAEIDAGNPVMLNLAGHTVVGVGYDDSSNLVYIHDTWDYNNHTFTWGTSYSDMALLSVSIVHLARESTPPTVTTSPADGASGVGLTDPITATFSEPMAVETINAANFTLNNGVTGTVTYNSTTRIATFTPSSGLTNNTTYIATISTAVTDAFGNALAAPKTWSFSTGQPKTLSVSISGNGSVNSDPSGIGCGTGNSGVCSYQFLGGQSITLTPTASNDSMFMTWPVGGCTSESNGNCNVTLTADKSITATFIILPPVFTGGSYYGSLQDAYNGGGTSCAIKAKAVVLPALNFTLDSVLAKTVTLEGGYDSTYSLKNDYTTLQGILTLKTGSLTVENLVIK